MQFLLRMVHIRIRMRSLFTRADPMTNLALAISIEQEHFPDSGSDWSLWEAALIPQTRRS